MLSIIGIVVSCGFVAWYFMMMMSRNRISVEEFAPVAVGMGVFTIALCIVGIFTSIKHENERDSGGRYY